MNYKKRIICLLLLIICLCLFMPNIGENNVSETHAISSEDLIVNKQDILPIDQNEMSSDLKSKCDVGSGQTPFDSATSSVMPGYLITPHTTTNSSGKDYNEIKNVKFSVLPFKISSGRSVYMWIYFPDDPLENWYSLSLGFDSGAGSIQWNFNATELYSLMNDISAYRYGWKLIELPFNTAIKSENYDINTELNRFTISYEIILSELSTQLGINGEFGDSSYLTNGKMSLYHMFVGNSEKNTPNIAINTNYCYYSLNQDFLAELDGLILNETYTVKQLSGMFNYIYAGKTNLLLYSAQNSNFEFTYTINSNSIDNDRYPGEKFTFSDRGECLFTITLKENRHTRNMLQLETKQEQKLVFKISHTMYIGEYNFGKFSESFYETEKGNNYVIHFKIKSDFNMQGEITFTSENEKTFVIKNVVYDTETGLYSVTINAKGSGRANLIAKATGTSSKKKSAQEYSSSTTIEVQLTASGYSELFKFILTLLVICAVSSLVFGFFTYMNIKKNKRLQKRQ